MCPESHSSFSKEYTVVFPHKTSHTIICRLWHFILSTTWTSSGRQRNCLYLFCVDVLSRENVGLYQQLMGFDYVTHPIIVSLQLRTFKKIVYFLFKTM